MSRKCAYCKTPFSAGDDAPRSSFCSPACQMKDLGKWFNEEYTVPTVSPDVQMLQDAGLEPEDLAALLQAELDV